MPKRSLSAQLDEMVQALMAGSPPPAVDPGLASASETLAALRDLPREQFRERLKAELQAAAASMKGRVSTMNVTPYLISPQGPELLEFTKLAFGAEELMRSIGSAGGMHAEVRLEGVKLMIGGGYEYKGPSRTCALHLHVPDVDAVYNRAIELGATSLGKPTDHEYGERGAGVKDLAGNFWYLATVPGEDYGWPGLPHVQPSFHPKGAAAFMDFLAGAFGAEELGRHATPDGRIVHATMRMGQSTVEIGEAHGPYQPMPSTMYLLVDDTDAVYNSAMKAGAASLSAPADQPYGARVAGVTDPFGHVWYIAAETRMGVKT